MRRKKISEIKVWPAITFISLFIILFHSSFKESEKQNFSQTFREYFTLHSKILFGNVLQLYNEVDKKDYNIDTAKAMLTRARMEYKSIEAFSIYFFPGDARYLNRPVIAEMEEDDEIGAFVVPHGFQYIEQLLYSDSVKYYRKKIREEVDFAYVIIGRFSESVSYMEIEQRDVFESMQMHLIRQFMLGLADFETAESRAGVKESAATLNYFKDFLKTSYKREEQGDSAGFNDLYRDIDRAVSFLNSVKSSTELDFFKFYSQYYIPVSEHLSRIRFIMASVNSYQTTPVNYEIRSVFDPNGFNSYFFLPAKQLASREGVIELGKTLFFDPALSANNLRACASCHQPGKAFTDGQALSEAFEPGKKLTRNAPTIINAVLQRKLFHDGRAFTFEDQAGQVMSNPLEMHNDFSQVAAKLRTSPEYVRWFRSAFAGYEDTIINNRSVLTAIAEYERSLIGMNSRFDKTISGRDNLMNEDERNGFNIYMGKANCASCHFIPLFNGTMLPEYVETEWEIIGVPSAKISAKRELDPDIGRAGIIDVNIFRHAFKTPTLRNIELTGPYMHNGVFRTLEEVIEFYDHGGGTNLGYDVPLQTLSSDSLHLSQQEKFQLIAFLKTLTDTVNMNDVPTSLPLFPENSNLNLRPIGGDY